MTRYGLSFWRSGDAAARGPARPRFSGKADVDVAIVGGGLTGCAIAQSLAAAGIRTALFEADRLGRGASGATDGVISLEPWASWSALEQARGRRDARAAWGMYRHAALDFAAALKRLRVGCGLSRQRAASVAAGAPPVQALEREHRARRDAGIESVRLSGARLRREIGIDPGLALMTSGAFACDPYRACLGLARAASARGCAIYEHSPLAGLLGRRGDLVELRFPSGAVSARLAVLATGRPPAAIPGLLRHFRASMAHHVVTPPLPAALRRQMGTGDAIVRLAGDPERRLRWTADHRMIFSGTGFAVPNVRSRGRALIQRTGQLMYELSLVFPVISGIQPEAGWDAALWTTADGLPRIGTHRNYPGCFFALGADRAGAASSFLAARIALRHVEGRPGRADTLFGFSKG